MASGSNEAGKVKQTTEQIAKDVELPRLTHYGDGKPLPDNVREVIEAIQKQMVDSHRKKTDRRPKSLPMMPPEFIYSEVSKKKDKVKMIELCDPGLDTDQCSCYEMFVSFRITKKQRFSKSPAKSWIWAGNRISFNNVSKDTAFNELMVIEVLGYHNPSVKVARKGRPKFPSIPDVVDELPSKLRSFHKGKLVGRLYSHPHLISSHQMTISWLRSRLHKAILNYSKIPEQELNPVIRQREKGPMFLHLSYAEEKDSGDEKAKREMRHVLFAVYPAFRVAKSCHLIVPVVPELIDTLPKDIDGAAHGFLWKSIIQCPDTQVNEHKHNELEIVNEGELKKIHPSRNSPESNDEAKKKAVVCKDVKRVLTPSQKQQCNACLNPVSRMLLEYYYEYSYIPEEEMNRADCFVEEILGFIKRSIKKDRRSNDPKIVDFVKSGSVPEKLKVVQADEFDVMVKIVLPASKMDYCLYTDDAFLPGFSLCLVKETGTLSPSLKRCLVEVDGFDYQHCLDPEKLAFGWLYGMLERAINKYKSPSNLPKADLKIKRGGPALMLQITPIACTDESLPPLPDEIKVDLVFALERSSTESRLFVPKRATLRSFYKINLKLGSSSVDENPENPTIAEEKKALGERTDNAKKYLGYMWRISYSVEEKKFLEYVDEQQRACGVQGCQNICLMILKTICAREALKKPESVICHKLSSYILKTRLFHMLSESDLQEDWKFDCLAERYLEFSTKLSMLQEELPHFFFNNERYLRRVFPGEDDLYSNETKSVDLFGDLHATLKLQLRKRLSCIAKSFKDCKRKMDQKFQEDGIQMRNSDSSEDSDKVYHEFLQNVLGNETPEEIIHPTVVVHEKSEEDEEIEKKLKEEQRPDEEVDEAVKNDQRSGGRLEPSRNLKSVQGNEGSNRGRKRKVEELEEDVDQSSLLLMGQYINEDCEYDHL